MFVGVSSLSDGMVDGFIGDGPVGGVPLAHGHHEVSARKRDPCASPADRRHRGRQAFHYGGYGSASVPLLRAQ